MTTDWTKLKSELGAVIDKWAAASAPPPVPVPPPAPAAGFTVKGGRIYDGAGQRVPIRGINHHGFNGDILRPQLLWVAGQDWIAQLAQMKSLGFNAIRLPFVPDTLYNPRKLGTWSNMVPGPGNDLFKTMMPIEALDAWMAEATKDFYVLLDYHSVSMIRQYPQWFVNASDQALIYNRQPYGKAEWIRDLVFVAKRYAKHARFLGIDLYNEPNGIVRWSAGDANMALQDYFWAPAAAEAAKAVLAANPNLLVFVQGTQANWDGIENTELARTCGWGENLQAQAYKPLAIPDAKLVLTPHTYGPYPGRMKPSFSSPDFPKNLAADWKTLFGQLFPQYAVVIGEWGGFYEGQDQAWQNALVDYMLATGMTDSFYWTFANSEDTGAILDNDGKVNAPKMANLHRLWGIP